MSGRVSGDRACKKLVVRATAQSDHGRRVSGYDDRISLGDFGSRLFEIKVNSSWNGQGRRPYWDITRFFGADGVRREGQFMNCPYGYYATEGEHGIQSRGA